MNFFVGLWPLIWHSSLALIAIGACVLIAVFVEVIAAWPPLKFLGLEPVAGRLRNIALMVAGGIAIGLVCYATGVSNEAARCKLQFTHAKVVAVKRGTTARTRARHDVDRGVHDPRDTDAGSNK